MIRVAGHEMDETEAIWLDGNAIAGMLEGMLGTDVTPTPRVCQSCGQVHAIGAHRLYRGAGLVLRCPNCDHVAARIGMAASHYRVEFMGTWQLDFER
jgi:hypothetical protein